jgi:hypothetical protein
MAEGERADAAAPAGLLSDSGGEKSFGVIESDVEQAARLNIKPSKTVK